MINNNRGSIFQIPVVLMGLIMVIAILVGLLPAMAELLNGAQASDSLNCAGYIDVYHGGTLNYSSLKQTSTIGCMSIKLYVPYIVLGVLIASVAVLFGQNINFGGQSTQQQGGGYY